MNEEISNQPIIEGKTRPTSKFLLVVIAAMLIAFVVLFIKQRFFS